MTVSVIVPTLDEEACIADMLRQLRQHRPHEIIVVDGGSRDATCEHAAGADLLLNGARGRAVQMNLGAAQAAGDVLLFLHADCALEAGALDDVARCLGNRRTVAGCFRMRVRAEGWRYRSIDACATARVRLTGLIYGDQGLFIRRQSFAAAGGFPHLALMEDLFFSLRLRRLGRVAVASRQIFVSPRRWQQTGLACQTLRNWGLTALAAAGIGPDQLARFYPPVR